MKACVGVDWDAEIDVWHWLQEMEELKVTVISGTSLFAIFGHMCESRGNLRT